MLPALSACDNARLDTSRAPEQKREISVDNNTLQVLLTLIAAVFALASAWISKANGEKAVAIKTAVAETAAVTTGRLEKLGDVAIATHVLVNSRMQATLKLVAVASRRLADITKDPTDIEAAVLAEKLHREHIARQDAVDVRGMS